MAAEPVPLAAAAQRLRGKPGRPRTASVPVLTVAPIAPRLLDLTGATLYLALKERKVRELVAAGVIPRVRVPDVGHGEVKKLLFDREQLDRLIMAWREPRAEAGR